MAVISSTSSTPAAVQSGLQQMKLQQAVRNAERAEQTARGLRAQAADAQRVADSAEESARALSVKSDQAQLVAGQARQGVAMIRSADQMQARLGSVATQVVKREQAPEASASVSVSVAASQATKAPVVNTQGQVTGTVVNTTA